MPDEAATAATAEKPTRKSNAKGKNAEKPETSGKSGDKRLETLELFDADGEPIQLKPRFRPSVRDYRVAKLLPWDTETVELHAVANDHTRATVFVSQWVAADDKIVRKVIRHLRVRKIWAGLGRQLRDTPDNSWHS